MIRRRIELATPENAKITVISIAKVWGTSLGIPHPGLQPTPRELEEQGNIVNHATKVLRSRGFEVRVQVVRTRNLAKMIARWAQAKHMHAIVLADPERPRWRRVLEGDLGAEVQRRSGIASTRWRRHRQAGARGRRSSGVALVSASSRLTVR